MKTILLIATTALLLFSSACEQYLSVRPDLSLASPNAVQDLQAILDNEFYFVQNYPPAGDVAADYFFLERPAWESLPLDYDRQSYTWDGYADIFNDWDGSYRSILAANVVIDQARSLSEVSGADNGKERVQGIAFFYRGWRYFLLSQLFAPQYLPGVNDLELGLPLRRSADINGESERATLEETYAFILSDLGRAAYLLPVATDIPTRPTKPAAYAALARVNLVIGNWEAAYRYADSCLQLHPDLIDYNEIPVGSSDPFDQFNREVLLHTILLASPGVFGIAGGKVDSMLIKKYEANDLRKTLLFRRNTDDSYSFKGNYSGDANSPLLFCGLATDEVYLTKAEALARLERKPEALNTLNELLIKRHDKSWTPYVLENHETDLLDVIIQEREKSLAFRGGIRWSDLRRLNTEPRFAKTLVRQLGEERYELPPNDHRYTFLIPSEVVQLTGMPKNRR